MRSPLSEHTIWVTGESTCTSRHVRAPISYSKLKNTTNNRNCCSKVKTVHVLFSLCMISVVLYLKHLPLNFSKYHRIIGWKRPLRSSSPGVNPTPQYLLNHVLKCHVYMFFKHLQGWGLHHFPGQPVPMPHHSFSGEIFPNIQSKSPLVQLEAIASHPITSYLGEETNTCLTTTSCQVVVESNKVTPSASSSSD